MSPTAISTTNSNSYPSRPLYKIASILAGGIGAEVISAGIQAFEKLATTLNTFDLDFTHIEWSSDYYRKNGRYLPDDALEQIRRFDAILFGAVGATGMWFNFLEVRFSCS